MPNTSQDSGAARKPGLAARLAELPQRVTRALGEYHAQRQLAGELDRLREAGQLDFVLRDLGLTQADVPVMTANHPGSARRLATMLQRIGVILTTEGHNSAEMRSIERSCLTCGATERCEHWLRSGASTGNRLFCPNAEAFDDLVASGKATRGSPR